MPVGLAKNTLLCGFYYKAFQDESFHDESYLAPCSHILAVLCSNVITSPGEERAGLYASSAFVCLSCMYYVPSLFSYS